MSDLLPRLHMRVELLHVEETTALAMDRVTVKRRRRGAASRLMRRSEVGLCAEPFDHYRVSKLAIRRRSARVTRTKTGSSIGFRFSAACFGSGVCINTSAFPL
jgi:hypothetical protein